MVMLREFYKGFEGKSVQILNKKIEKIYYSGFVPIHSKSGLLTVSY
jgi:hypothetical protein